MITKYICFNVDSPLLCLYHLTVNILHIPSHFCIFELPNTSMHATLAAGGGAGGRSASSPGSLSLVQPRLAVPTGGRPCSRRWGRSALPLLLYFTPIL